MENLTYADKQLVAAAAENDRKLKEIREHQSPEEIEEEKRTVSLALSGSRMKTEQIKEEKLSEDDKEARDKIEHKLKKKNNDLW